MNRYKVNTRKMSCRLAIIVFVFYSSTLFAKTYSILIGVENYKSQNPLNYAVDDAQLMYDILAQGENKKTTILLTNEKASKGNIEKYMNRIATRIKKDDVLIFYFAGHGMNKGIICYDKTLDYLITYREIKSWLRRCKTNNKFLFLDSCSAANLFVSTPKEYEAFEEHCSKSVTERVNTSNNGEQFALFLSSDIGEVSYELSKYKHGVFTFYLSRGLLGKADYNNDGFVNIEELYIYVRNKTFGLSKYFSNDTQCPLLIGNFDKNTVLSVYK